MHKVDGKGAVRDTAEAAGPNVTAGNIDDVRKKQEGSMTTPARMPLPKARRDGRRSLRWRRARGLGSRAKRWRR